MYSDKYQSTFMVVFAFGSPIFPALFTKEDFYYLLNVFGFFVKNCYWWKVSSSATMRKIISRGTWGRMWFLGKLYDDVKLSRFPSKVPFLSISQWKWPKLCF